MELHHFATRRRLQALHLVRQQQTAGSPAPFRRPATPRPLCCPPDKPLPASEQDALSKVDLPPGRHGRHGGHVTHGPGGRGQSSNANSVRPDPAPIGFSRGGSPAATSCHRLPPPPCHTDCPAVPRAWPRAVALLRHPLCRGRVGPRGEQVLERAEGCRALAIHPETFLFLPGLPPFATFTQFGLARSAGREAT